MFSPNLNERKLNNDFQNKYINVNPNLRYNFTTQQIQANTEKCDRIFHTQSGNIQLKTQPHPEKLVQYHKIITAHTKSRDTHPPPEAFHALISDVPRIAKFYTSQRNVQRLRRDADFTTPSAYTIDLILFGKLFYARGTKNAKEPRNCEG